MIERGSNKDKGECNEIIKKMKGMADKEKRKGNGEGKRKGKGKMGGIN